MIRSGLTAAALALFSGVAFAQSGGCILVKTAAEIERVTSDAKGRKAVHLVPADRIEPGNRVIYTVSAANICERPAEHVLIEIPVPKHMTYVAGSAIGPVTVVSFSIDGGYKYDKPDALRVSMADGTQRKAVPKDYTHIRWAMRKPLEPGAVALVRFRAIFE